MTFMRRNGGFQYAKIAEHMRIGARALVARHLVPGKIDFVHQNIILGT